MNLSSYSTLGFVNVMRMLLGRTIERHARWMLDFGRHGMEMDMFVRHANLHGCQILKEGEQIVVQAPESLIGKAHRVKLRLNTSDLIVYTSSVMMADYKPLVNLIGQGSNANTIGYIVDAGANIGSVSLYLRANFPHAKIISIEADASNHAMLVENMRANHVENLECKLAAVWANNEPLSIGDSDGRHWGKTVAKAAQNGPSESSVASITMDDILAQSPNGRIDILKMDIEGAEDGIFDENLGPLEWLNHVRFLAIEIHGPPLTERIHDLLRRRGFAVHQTGETTYGENRRFSGSQAIGGSRG